MGQQRKQKKSNNNSRKEMAIGVSALGMYHPEYWLQELQPFIKPTIFLLNYNDLPESLDFIIFDGGMDVYPSFYGELKEDNIQCSIRRDTLEMFIFSRYFNTPTKFVGICRGHQFLNVLMKGTLYQDLALVNMSHNGGHPVVTAHSILHKYVPDKFHVNSMHHQAVKDVGFGLIPTLREPETNIIEGLEMNPEIKFPSYLEDKIRSVQCHPEMSGFREADNLMRYLFRVT